MHEPNKSVVSVAEMARMVGLSRQRFYQLQGSTFPFPLYSVATRRPFYTEEMQQVCLEVRKRNCGIDGKPVLFYASGHHPRTHGKKRPTKKSQKSGKYVGICDGLAALGLAVKEEQVVTAVKQLFPSGIEGQDDAEVLREVFLFLKRQD